MIKKHTAGFPLQIARISVGILATTRQDGVVEISSGYLSSINKDTSGYFMNNKKGPQWIFEQF
jgi:hypothetical protein